MEIEIIHATGNNIYKVSSVHYIGKEDSFSILKNHAPLIKLISNGLLTTKGINKLNIDISKSIIKVTNNYISLLVLDN